LATILVVDDDRGVLDLCQRILELGGHSVLPCSGGEDAVRVVQSSAESIDLAVLDIIMPGMNGIQLADRIRLMSSSLPIILMTGYSLREVQEITGENNPYRIIWKPFKADSLLRMIENGLANRSAASV
jgi:two-component system cell cycle sensor histidine kinase/response regulator CckA